MFVIADIAGQLDALERLVAQAPKGERIVLVGDLVDRGPYSFEVIEWAMKNKNVITLMGNHEHMMLDFYRPMMPHGGLYAPDNWAANGGSATRASYSRAGFKKPPEAHLDWIAQLPMLHWSDDRKCLVTHAALAKRFTPESIPFEYTSVMDPDFDASPLWNRGEPVRRDFFQVFGHNPHWGLRGFMDEGTDDAWALCIDQSRKQILTGFHWPTGQLIEEPYLRSQPKEKEMENAL